jgi:predicted transglutaminase-like protease
MVSSWTVSPLKMGPIGSPKTSVSNHLMLCNNPEDFIIIDFFVILAFLWTIFASCWVTVKPQAFYMYRLCNMIISKMSLISLHSLHCFDVAAGIDTTVTKRRQPNY